MFKNLIIILVYFISFNSCNEIDSPENHLYNQLISQILDSISTTQQSLKNKTIIIGPHQSERLNTLIKKNLLLEFENDTSGPGKMVMRLVDRLGEPIDLNIKKNEKYDLEKINSKELAQQTAKEIRQGMKSNTVLIYLSPIIFDDRVDNIGCFYMSIEEGSLRSYISFIQLKNEEWRLMHMLKFIE